MDLRTFVTTALLDVVNGVRDAQAACDDASFAPHVGTADIYLRNGVSSVQVIEFEVSVSAASEQGAGGGLKVIAAIVGGDVSGSHKASSTCASIVKFRVPVELPHGRDLERAERKTLSSLADERGF